MPARARRLVAGFGTLAFLAFYVWGVIAIADRLPENPLIDLMFYAVAGIAWGLPLIPLLRWAEGNKT
jgi:hypothetical protein